MDSVSFDHLTEKIMHCRVTCMGSDVAILTGMT
jgi:hypothetical protein